MRAATGRTVQHGTFTIERDFAFPSARVFAAWAEREAKDRWFGGPSGQWKPLRNKDAGKANAVMQAMLKMGKLDIAGLQRAYDHA